MKTLFGGGGGTHLSNPKQAQFDILTPKQAQFGVLSSMSLELTACRVVVNLPDAVVSRYAWSLPGAALRR
jgi:hypothetical protein